MTGKEKCRLLRQIRKEIAESNGIDYITTECTYEGDDCLGTCPKCDEEITYLDAELNRKIADGELVTIAGISLDTFLTGLPTATATAGFSNALTPTIGSVSAENGGGDADSSLRLTIEEVGFSVRTFNCLKGAGIETIADLIEKTESDLMTVRNMGKKSLDEIIKKLARLGLSLKEEPSDDDFFVEGDIACGGLTEIASDEVKLQITIEELDLSVRSFNCLERAGINTVADLINLTIEELMQTRNLGKKSVEEIIKKVHDMGLYFLEEDSAGFTIADLW